MIKRQPITKEFIDNYRENLISIHNRESEILVCVRNEIEDLHQSEDYINGYMKGIRVALADILGDKQCELGNLITDKLDIFRKYIGQNVINDWRTFYTFYLQYLEQTAIEEWKDFYLDNSQDK